MLQRRNQFYEEVNARGKIVIGRIKHASVRYRIHMTLGKMGLHSRTIDTMSELDTLWKCYCGEKLVAMRHERPSAHSPRWGYYDLCRRRSMEGVNIHRFSGNIEISANPLGGCKCAKCRAGIEGALSILPQRIYDELVAGLFKPKRNTILPLYYFW
jgi:hypothetical protein